MVFLLHLPCLVVLHRRQAVTLGADVLLHSCFRRFCELSITEHAVFRHSLANGGMGRDQDVDNSSNANSMDMEIDAELRPLRGIVALLLSNDDSSNNDGSNGLLKVPGSSSNAAQQQ